MQFRTTLQKQYELNVNQIGIYGEKLTFFFTLKKQRATQYAIKKLITNDNEDTDQTRILEHIKDLYKTVFDKKLWLKQKFF